MENGSRTKKVVIVGGVAGGANAAARLRRLDEHMEIVVFERSGYVSFANCGLPYHIGDEISKRRSLLLHTPETLRARFNIDVRIHNEVLSIDRQARTVSVKDLTTSSEYTETYERLILAPGAAPLRPPIPGLDLPGIFSLRNIEDMDAILARLKACTPKSVLVVGGGFIGLEMLEQLHSKFAAQGSKLILAEMNPHLLAPLDEEMVTQIEAQIRSKDITLVTGDAITSFEASAGGISALTKAGKRIESDFVLFNIGVKPETTLAEKAGLTLGARGGIKVDSELRTSDPNIFAVGDCIETQNIITAEFGLTPLAGPANRQGRVAADIICGLTSHVKGVAGTAIVRVFELTAAVTGANERTLKRLKIPYKKVYLHPNSHAGYYPGASAIHLKLLYSAETRKVIGAQAVGRDGVDKRIDVLATAIYAGLTVDDLIDLDLCYAPPFGSAKDPVNLAGMVAQNELAELVENIGPLEFASEMKRCALLDVRNQDERAKGFIPESIHIPLGELRQRLSELPTDRPLIVYCHSGQRSYNACRILKQHGFRCKNLSGAYASWRHLAQS